MLDAYQYNGIPIVHDELDIDTMSDDFSDAIKAFYLEHNYDNYCSKSPKHIVLILDKHCQHLPWENLPILRGQPVSRLPSYSVAQTLLERAPHMFKGPCYYILNPGGDLKRTQKVFECVLER